MNKALLVGRLTRDPELRTTPGGIAVTRFTIAISEPYTNKNGERETNFINCVAWGRQADNISKYCIFNMFDIQFACICGKPC